MDQLGISHAFRQLHELHQQRVTMQSSVDSSVFSFLLLCLLIFADNFYLASIMLCLHLRTFIPLFEFFDIGIVQMEKFPS